MGRALAIASVMAAIGVAACSIATATKQNPLGDQATAGQILEIVKYAGFALAAASAIWALASKTTFEDDQNRRRLTAAGHVAVAFIIGSALLSATAFGFETLVKQQAAAEQLANKRIEDQDKKETELRRHLEAAQASQALAQQRSLTIALAGQEEARQLQMARDINRSSTVALARADATLAQLQRAMQPLGSVQVAINVMSTWKGLKSVAIDRLSAIGREYDRSGADPTDFKGIWLSHGPDPFGEEPGEHLDFIEVNPTWDGYPTDEGFDHLYYLVRASAVVGVISRERVSTKLVREMESIYSFGSRPDLSDLSVRESDQRKDGRKIRFYPDGRLEFQIKFTANELQIRRTGNVVSAADLAGALLVVELEISDLAIPEVMKAENASTLTQMSLIIGGRRFELVEQQLEPHKDVYGDTFFLARNLRPVQATRVTRGLVD
jgi:hypothetical protein